MEEYVVPDKVKAVAIEDGELHLHEGYDTIHRFKRLGFGMLKYWIDEKNTIINLCIDEAGIDFLHNEVGLGLVERTSITVHEHNIYLNWAASRLDTEFES